MLDRRSMGFKVDLSMDAFKDTLRKVGVAMIAASSTFTPADRKCYALRDVTATVPSVALQVCSCLEALSLPIQPSTRVRYLAVILLYLQTSSIMCKKIAGWILVD